MVPVKSCMVPVGKIVKVDRDILVKTAAEMMRDNGIGSVIVTSGEEIIGILTDTDLVRRVVAAGADPMQTTVEKIMSAPIVSIEADRTLLDANDLMAKEHIRHLGITQDGTMVGMISVRDLVVFLTNLPRK
ncbi:MAG: CBS domain-containing protein [Nitrospirota bacterium]|nr:CBS domain-containing protein [Nitrospirota bacterium]MDH5700219.1 CBS domain-containing protein [Nitrospirota bacterium]